MVLEVKARRNVLIYEEGCGPGSVRVPGSNYGQYFIRTK